jgi:hypothetical protein
MPAKEVDVNGVLVGEASTWAQVYLLIEAKNIGFRSKLSVAEGPCAFYLNGAELGRERDAPGADRRGSQKF